MASTKTKSSSQLQQVRQLYRTATSSFLVRDYASTAQALSAALALLPSPASSDADANATAWLDAVEANGPVPSMWDAARKLQILRATFLATVLAPSSPSTATVKAPSLASFPQDIRKLAELQLDALLAKLWHLSLTPTSTETESDGIFPTTSAANLHPSLPIALAFAALKLQESRSARQVLEAWFGSTSDQLERIIWTEASSEALDWARDFPVSAGEGEQTTATADVALGSSMTASGILPQPQKPTPRRQLLASWVKALDLLTLHVLPGLGEWEAAGDFIRLQGVENGGMVPDARVEAALAHLSVLQQRDAQSDALRAERQRQLEARKKALDQPPPLPSKNRRSDKGKERATATASGSKERRPRSSDSGSSSSSPPSSSPRTGHGKLKGAAPDHASSSAAGPVAAAPETGFAALRSTLSSYLSRSSPNSQLATRPGLPILHLLQDDPLRLLSMVCLFVAFTSWVRRRRRMGLRSLPVPGPGDVGAAVWGVLARVAETMKMGTKVTQL